MRKIGSRVGAFRNIDEGEKKAYFFGFGVYEGNFYPETAAGFTAELAKRVVGDDYVNPKIKLDNGKVVWGCECWWTSEEETQKQIETLKKHGFEIVEVDIDDDRENWSK